MLGFDLVIKSGGMSLVARHPYYAVRNSHYGLGGAAPPPDLGRGGGLTCCQHSEAVSKRMAPTSSKCSGLMGSL